MTRTVLVKNNFWDNDFCGQKGYDNICERLKDSKKMCSDLLDFLKERAKIEEKYSTSLKRLAQQGGGKTEIGTMKNAYESLLTHTGKIGEAHGEAAAAIHDTVERVIGLMDSQNAKRRDATQRTKTCIDQKKDLYNKVIKARKSYEDKCKQVEVLASQKESLKMSSSVNPKDMEKANKNHNKAELEQIKLDTDYKDYVNRLEASRQAFEAEMNKLCDTMEELEEDKVNNLRNEMWVLTNITSQTCVNDDEYCENIRQSLEKCDPGRDILQFIEEKKTGSAPPGAIPYQKYGEKRPSPGGGNQVRQGREPRHQQLPIRPPVNTFEDDDDPMYATLS